MTYYELIRACLLLDAEEHPYPKKDGAIGPFRKDGIGKDGQQERLDPPKRKQR